LLRRDVCCQRTGTCSGWNRNRSDHPSTSSGVLHRWRRQERGKIIDRSSGLNHSCRITRHQLRRDKNPFSISNTRLDTNLNKWRSRERDRRIATSTQVDAESLKIREQDKQPRREAGVYKLLVRNEGYPMGNSTQFLAENQNG
jgi:hypothetical protein